MAIDMDNSCTIIPTYPPHYAYTINAIITHNQFVKSDLYLIFTNNQDYILFNQTISNLNLTHLRWKFLILDFVPRPQDNIITIKKFYAVEKLLTLYKYIGVFDSEILFVKTFDTDTVYQKIDDSKIFKSNKRHNSNHLFDLSSIMGYEENKILISETENFTQYWWFNEICVYEREKFSEFYQWFKEHKNYDNIINKFMSFDYLIYSIWLICNKQYKLKKHLKNYSLAGAAVETNYCDDSVSYEFLSYQDRNINHVNIEHIKVQIMIDRDINHCLKEGERRWIG